MQTPRLCIDGRGANEFASQGELVQELIDELVSARGEPNLENPWIDKQRTVLLSHPQQIFTGQLRRFDTRRRIGSSFFYWAWERNFIESAKISAFHRFRPIDRMRPNLDCFTITTLLPPQSRLPRSLGENQNQFFVVPSEKDRAFLTDRYALNENQIFVVTPSIRRWMQYENSLNLKGEGWVLLLTEPRTPVDITKLRGVLADRFPQIPIKVISLHERSSFHPGEWKKILQNTRVCFYLTRLLFDWPLLPLELFYAGTPVVWMGDHPTLSELLPKSCLTLSEFLIERPMFETLVEQTKMAQWKLAEKGIFEPFSLAKQYQAIYKRLKGSDVPGPESCGAPCS